MSAEERGYIRLHRGGELQARVEKALLGLESCRVCPRNCGVNRREDEKAACRTGRRAVVSSFFPHFGEEDCLRGTRGSGTIFFSNCNLRCVFCQNFDISQEGLGEEVGREDLAWMMLDLQKRGCHNINFVTPEHVVPQILEALPLAIQGGLHLPIVYNTSAYDSLESLRAMDGIVDIYMPDFKFWDPATSRRLLKAQDYPDAARAAIREMHRQVGDLSFDSSGVATRGLLVRHLVMPEGLAGTREVMKFLAREISSDTFVNLMAQYHPAGRTEEHPDINRPITAREYLEAVRIAGQEGIHRLDSRRRNTLLLSL